jgi:hypothetical protein
MYTKKLKNPCIGKNIEKSNINGKGALPVTDPHIRAVVAKTNEK